MDPAHDAFLARLRATFRTEARELAQTIAAGLLELEKTPDRQAERRVIETVFRAAHSLKGAARAVDLPDVESGCQALEDVLADWKSGKARPTPAALDDLHRRLDAVVAGIATVGPQSAPVDVPASAVSPVPEMAAEETVRIPVAKLEGRMLQAEEMLTAKLVAARQTDDLTQLARRVEDWRKSWPTLDRDESLERLKTVERDLTGLARHAARDRQAIGKIVDDLLEDSKELLVLPFATLVAPFPKLVRDLCRDQGKEADLVVRGEDVEIDKRILDEMKAPLVHLLRNAIDHGIEPPAERLRAGKPTRATITLAASRVNGHKVQLLVSDDGAGIDVEKLKAAAVTRGAVTAAEAQDIDEARAHRLAFEPEVSTTRTVTRLSGRGLGLAIVRESAQRVGGNVAVESEPGRGTTFRAVVPSLLTTYRGILIEAAQQSFIVPTLAVERVVRIRPGDVRTVEGRESVTVGARGCAGANGRHTRAAANHRPHRLGPRSNRCAARRRRSAGGVSR
jgi:two-component system chemotaxis sensor kinase CheA